MSSVFIVDDRSPSIQYDGSWIGAGSGGEFNLTTTTPIGQNASATFNFTGTSVSVFASIDIGDGEIFFQVDNNTGTYTNPITAPVQHFALYQSPLLPDGAHTLVMNVVSNPPPRVFFDYILYNSSSTGLGSILVDDSDTSKINYNGAWTSFSSDTEMGHSGHRAGIDGASSFSVSFNGTGVGCYGDLSNTTNGHNLSVVIDNALPQIIPFPNVTSPIPSSKIFTSDLLLAGKHTITVTVPKDSPFSLDFLLVTPIPGSGGNSSSSPPPQPEPTQASSKSSAGAIAGGVIGAVAAILLLCVIGLWYRRKHRERSINTVQPFDPPTSNSVTDQPGNSLSEPTTNTLSSKQPMSELSTIPNSTIASGPDIAPTATGNSTIAIIPRPHSGAPPPVDSGLRFPRDSTRATVPPPDYTAD